MNFKLKKIIELESKYIEEKGKFFGTVILLFKSISRIVTIIYLLFFKRVSINEKIILLYSDADFSDNARALSDYMEEHQEYRKYKIYWAVENVKECKKTYKDTMVTFIPKYRNSLNELSIALIKIHMKAKYIMVTHSFLLASKWKKSNQIYIMLWHGCGYKDTNRKKIENGRNNCFDYALLPGELFIKTKEKFWGVSERLLLPIGQPRYNWMLHSNKKAFEYAETFRKNSEKIVIWMPTFRNAKRRRTILSPRFPEESIKQFPLLRNEKDWEKLDNYCGKQGISLIIKLHIYQEEYDIDFSKYIHIHAIGNDDIEKNGVQLYEFLAVTDALITDYSSVAFDYLLLDKPIGFVLDDFELYKSSRGFIFENPLEYMPGHHIYDSEQLQTFLEDVVNERDIYKDYRCKVKSEAIYTSDDYCKEILNYFSI